MPVFATPFHKRYRCVQRGLVKQSVWNLARIDTTLPYKVWVSKSNWGTGHSLLIPTWCYTKSTFVTSPRNFTWSHLKFFTTLSWLASKTFYRKWIDRKLGRRLINLMSNHRPGAYIREQRSGGIKWSSNGEHFFKEQSTSLWSSRSDQTQRLNPQFSMNDLGVVDNISREEEASKTHGFTISFAINYFFAQNCD